MNIKVMSRNNLIYNQKTAGTKRTNRTTLSGLSRDHPILQNHDQFDCYDSFDFQICFMCSLITVFRSAMCFVRQVHHRISVISKTVSPSKTLAEVTFSRNSQT
jgi:hypothetical protein